MAFIVFDRFHAVYFDRKRDGLKERSAVSQSNAAIATIHVEGLDQAGIVYKISQFLAENSLNIIDLKSIVKTTPESGTSLYLMDIHIHLTGGATPESIEEGLDDVALDGCGRCADGMGVDSAEGLDDVATSSATAVGVSFGGVG